MPIFKQRTSENWHVVVQVGGKRIRRSAKTANRQEALAYEKRLRDQLYKVVELGQDQPHTWDEAALAYVREKEDEGQASIHREKYHLRWLTPHLRGRELHTIDAPLIKSLLDKKRAEGVKPRTVNALLNLIRTILRKAKHNWDWMPRHDLPSFNKLSRKEPKRRVRWITRQEAAQLIDELPAHLKPVVAFSLETGLRLANVTGLRWSEVDLARRTAWVYADEIKNRRAALAVPLSKIAVVTIREQLGKHQTQVFSYEGRAMRYVNKAAWRKALARAGIENFRWHDLRHTWASWHVQDGTPLPVLQALGGWESIEMVQKYAHLGDEHLRHFVDNRQHLRVVGQGEEPDQSVDNVAGKRLTSGDAK
jgi:integrase